MRGIDHLFPEDCEVFMFLYDSSAKKQMRYIEYLTYFINFIPSFPPPFSERFLINVPKDVKMGKSHYCIFKVSYNNNLFIL